MGTWPAALVLILIKRENCSSDGRSLDTQGPVDRFFSLPLPRPLSLSLCDCVCACVSVWLLFFCFIFFRPFRSCSMPHSFFLYPSFPFSSLLLLGSALGPCFTTRRLYVKLLGRLPTLRGARFHEFLVSRASGTCWACRTPPPRRAAPRPATPRSDLSSENLSPVTYLGSDNG
jgi:hypothetical protein